MQLNERLGVCVCVCVCVCARACVREQTGAEEHHAEQESMSFSLSIKP